MCSCRTWSFFFFNQKTAYEIRISDWSSDVCSSDLTELTHFIGGKHVKGTSGRSAQVFNPATGEAEKRVPLASAAELDAAVAHAREAQPAWAAVNPQRRPREPMKFVELPHRDMDNLARSEQRSAGNTTIRPCKYVAPPYNTH